MRAGRRTLAVTLSRGSCGPTADGLSTCDWERRPPASVTRRQDAPPLARGFLEEDQSPHRRAPCETKLDKIEPCGRHRPAPKSRQPAARRAAVDHSLKPMGGGAHAVLSLEQGLQGPDLQGWLAGTRPFPSPHQAPVLTVLLESCEPLMFGLLHASSCPCTVRPSDGRSSRRWADLRG